MTDENDSLGLIPEARKQSKKRKERSDEGKNDPNEGKKRAKPTYASDTVNRGTGVTGSHQPNAQSRKHEFK